MPGSWGWCPLRRLTGLSCPFCGGLRAVDDLARGHAGDALASNGYVVLVVLPLAVLLWATWAVRRWRDPYAPAPALPAAVAWAVLGAGVLFAVVRDLPLGLPLGP
ncbi:uncharacterized protein DUF2752 [Motilibacter rhizosphaerae]|uniref:Uncharacterized protein DUF2752 n=1 Tax=Motilibacter rhizosphaerae TaxID=598652 RepID=A0A4Q7NGM9_9ACTN|nr:DUF2752 domain-containing protein [Motilibacter rhizosphaerae]RZS82878.1 uncharacterized protein DUF2752 [Motilibacter rhizosphaerae]